MGRRCVVEGASVGMSFELESLGPDMKCPAIPDHGGNNFWKSSCKVKQKIPELHQTCYPHCKKVAAGVVPPEKRTYDTRPIASEYAISVGKMIVGLYHQGFTREQIAEKVSRGKETVSKRLREAGICNPRRINSLRERMLKYLEERPETSAIKLQEIFKSARSTAEGYKKDFNRGARA